MHLAVRRLKTFLVVAAAMAAHDSGAERRTVRHLAGRFRWRRFRVNAARQLIVGRRTKLAQSSWLWSIDGGRCLTAPDDVLSALASRVERSYGAVASGGEGPRMTQARLGPISLLERLGSLGRAAHWEGSDRRRSLAEGLAGDLPLEDQTVALEPLRCVGQEGAARHRSAKAWTISAAIQGRMRSRSLSIRICLKMIHSETLLVLTWRLRGLAFERGDCQYSGRNLDTHDTNYDAWCATGR